MKKLYSNIFLVFIIGFLGYNSLYFKKLNEMSKVGSAKFNFAIFADSLYKQGILKQTHSVELSQLLSEYEKNIDTTFSKFGNRLGIGNSAFFMVNGMGKVIEKNENGIKILTNEGVTVELETKFLFGNAIRDASKLVKLTDFKSNKEFNTLSEALNTIIREKAIPAQTENIKTGDAVSFRGAIKLSKKTKLALVIYPVEIKAIAFNKNI